MVPSRLTIGHSRWTMIARFDPEVGEPDVLGASFGLPSGSRGSEGTESVPYDGPNPLATPSDFLVAVRREKEGV